MQAFTSFPSRLCLLTFDDKNSQSFNMDLGNSSSLIECIAKKQSPLRNLLKTHKSCPKQNCSAMSTSITESKCLHLDNNIFKVHTPFAYFHKLVLTKSFNHLDIRKRLARSKIFICTLVLISVICTFQHFRLETVFRFIEIYTP